MYRPAGLLALAIIAIVGAWWWLGAPVAMPASPLDAGEKLYCISYAPFRDGQNPLDPTIRVERWQIDEDLTKLARLTGCVRTYSVTNGLDAVPEIARRLGLKVIQGLWLSSKPALNREQIATTVALAKQYPDVISAVVVGNEVLLRGEMAAGDLANTIRAVKAQVSMPVTYADVWEFWLRYREIYDAVDFVTIHILPYWEDFPIPARQAAAHVDSIRKRLVTAFPGKDVLIGETGWPSAGRMRAGALPSPANQARVLHDVLALAKRENFHVNVIEAFDQPWKRALEGTVGGRWGLLDAYSRDFKFTWGQPVSNHPFWRWQAAGGAAFAVVMFAAALFAQRRRSFPEPSLAVWAAIAVTAAISGITAAWAIENVPIESFGAGGWTRSLALAATAILAPIAGAMALACGERCPSFAEVLRRDGARKQTPLARMMGLLLIILGALAIEVALGFVFDPRYLDFPFAPLTAAAMPFVMLSLLGRRGAGARGAAEVAMAAVLAGSALYMVPNEAPANWQALWLGGIFIALAAILVRQRAAPD